MVNVAVVGAGRTGAPLIERMLQLPYVQLVGVADKDPDSPGCALARAAGVFCVEDADVLAAKGDAIDIIVDVSGDPAVKPALRDAFIAQGNRVTVIVPDIVARLLLSLATGSEDLVETFHPEDRGIG
jgi:dihydrodipicolinate reductase